MTREHVRLWHATVRDLIDVAWFRLHPTLPPPHGVKVGIVLDYARRAGIRTLVETGTCRGAMVSKCARAFDKIFTIELDPVLARLAGSRLARFAHVHVRQGDSGRLLREILAIVREPCLFWLDAHWSGGDTAMGDTETPLVEELQAIIDHGHPGHVVLIDDARMFGTGVYPTQAGIEAILFRMNPHARSWIANDVYRFEPHVSRPTS